LVTSAMTEKSRCTRKRLRCAASADSPGSGVYLSLAAACFTRAVVAAEMDGWFLNASDTAATLNPVS